MLRTKRGLALTLLGLTSCVTAPQIDLAPAEKVSRDAQIVEVFRSDLEAWLKPKKAESIEPFLQEILQKLQVQSEAFKDFAGRIQVIRRSHRTLGLPKLDLFVSMEMLKRVRYENEIAAAMALEMALLQKGLLAEKFSATWGNEDDDGGDDGELSDSQKAAKVWRKVPRKKRTTLLKRYYSLTRNELEGVLPDAVTILYLAGYDSRGLAGLWKRHYSKHWPRQNENSSIVQSIYRAISQYPPLRNPVVSSVGFERLKRKIGQL